MLTIGLSILVAVLSLASLVFLIKVLIKQFSKGGVLQGLLGVITCGFWTFVWGWIKHRQYNLTKVMTMWSVCYAVSIVVSFVAGTALSLQMAKLVGQATGEFKAEVEKKSHAKINLPRNTKPPLGQAAGGTSTPSRNAAVGDADAADPEKLAEAAMALWQNGSYTDPDRAASHWSALLEARPDAAEAFNNRGLAHYVAGRYPRAISDFDNAIRINPGYAVAFNNRGNAYYQTARYQEALKDYSTSLNLDGGYAKAYSNRGLAYLQLKNAPQACRDFQKACELGDCEFLKWSMASGTCK